MSQRKTCISHEYQFYSGKLPKCQVRKYEKHNCLLSDKKVITEFVGNKWNELHIYLKVDKCSFEVSMVTMAGPIQCDYCVVGAGMIGSAVAKHLQVLNPSSKVVLVGQKEPKVIHRISQRILGPTYDDLRVLSKGGTPHGRDFRT